MIQVEMDFLFTRWAAQKSRQFVLGGHLRMSVSPDGSTVKRIDPLSQTLLIDDEKHTGLPKGTHLVASYYNQIVSKKPVEALIYIKPFWKTYFCPDAGR